MRAQRFSVLAAVTVVALGLSNSARAAQDTDSDGFPDSIEILLGTDFSSAASTPTGAAAAAPVLFPVNTAVYITLDFVNPDADSATLQTYLPVPPGFDFTGQQVAVDIGGYSRLYTLNAGGTIDPDPTGFAVFAPVPGAPGDIHLAEFSASGLPLASFFNDEGLVSTAPPSGPASIDATVYFNGALYTSTFSGGFSNLVSSGVATFIILPTGPVVEIEATDFSAQPNPANAGDTITFTGAVSLSSKDAQASATLDFGDGTAPFAASGDALESALKDGITHAYAANGVYVAQLSLFASGMPQMAGRSAGLSVQAFVIIGDDSVVNSLNGMICTETVDDTGLVSLQINIARIPGATTASTTFEETLSREAPIGGLFPSRAFTTPGIAVATTVAQNDAGEPKAKIRNMVVVSAKNTGDSGALPAPASTEIVLKKMSGKFVFSEGKPDQVSFSGTVTLPQGFNPALEGGNTLVIGIGNITDKIQVNAKGKALDKSTGSGNRIKKLSLKYPKLASGIAAGGETAQLGVTLGMTGMSAAGFDTEGVTASLRADEEGRKTVPRFIQVSMLLAGVAYEAYLPVSFKLSAKKDTGQISGRAGR